MSPWLYQALVEQLIASGLHGVLQLFASFRVAADKCTVPL